MTDHQEKHIEKEDNLEQDLKLETEKADNIADESSNMEDLASETKEKKKKGIFSKKKESEVDVLKKQIEELSIEKSEMHDRYLRLYSEFDNYRKRTNKDKIELIKNASEEMIRAILPVVDDFERAIKTADNIEGSEAIKEGVLLIYSKLMTILKQKGLSPIESIGKPFDTDFHEAITNIPATDESQKGNVVDEIQKGYLLNEKIIRHAKVVVAN